MTQHRILFIDLAERDRLNRARIRSRVGQLEAIENTKSRTGGLGPDLRKELDELRAVLASDITSDRLYQAVAAQVAGKPWEVLSGSTGEDSLYVMKYGFIGSQCAIPAPKALGPIEQQILAVCGLLELDNVDSPEVHDFVSRVTIARGEYDQNRALFDVAFDRFDTRHLVTLQSQIDKGYVDPAAVGFLDRKGKDPATAFTDHKAHEPAGTTPVYAASSSSVGAIVRRMRDDGISPLAPARLGERCCGVGRTAPRQDLDRRGGQDGLVLGAQPMPG